MNKLLIVLLAVCLVSTHAFVKRDAPAPATSDLQKQIDDLKTKFEELGQSVKDEATKILDPAAIQKQLEDALNIAKQALEKIKPSDAKPADAKPAA